MEKNKDIVTLEEIMKFTEDELKQLKEKSGTGFCVDDPCIEKLLEIARKDSRLIDVDDYNSKDVTGFFIKNRTERVLATCINDIYKYYHISSCNGLKDIEYIIDLLSS